MNVQQGDVTVENENYGIRLIQLNLSSVLNDIYNDVFLFRVVRMIIQSCIQSVGVNNVRFHNERILER